MWIPTPSVVTVNNTSMFDTPPDAERFLCREAGDWDPVSVTVSSRKLDKIPGFVA